MSYNQKRPLSQFRAFLSSCAYFAGAVVLFLIGSNQYFGVCNAFALIALVVAVVYFVRGYNMRKADQLAAENALQTRTYDEPSTFGASAPNTTPGSGYIGLDFTSPRPPESV